MHFTDRERVCMSVYWNLSRRVTAAFWTNSVVLAGPVACRCLQPWLPSTNMLVLKFSYLWYGMGENSPTMYGLQCSLKTWLSFHPGCMAREIYTFFKIVFHRHT